MTATLEGLAAQVHRQAVASAVRDAAPALAVRAEELLDSQSFAEAVRDLDPAGPEFATGVCAAAQAAAERDPARFRVQAPAQPVPPAADGPQQWTRERALAAPPGALAEAIDAGLLRDLGFAPDKRRRG